MSTYLTDLADLARRADLRTLETPGWDRRGHGGLGAPRTITVHHTAGAATGDAPSLRTVVDGRPDLAGPLAHLLVARSGTVHIVAAGQCWHTGKTREPWQGNAYSIGIEVENAGTPADRYPTVQLDALARLCHALCARYDIPHARVLGHREIADPPGRKVDPLPETLDMRALRAALSTPPPAPREDAVALSDEDIERIADAVWRRAIVNSFGDTVEARQILNGTEKRTAEILEAVKR